MITLPNLDSLKQLDPTKIDLTRFDVRNLDLPKIDLPKIDLPKIDVRNIDLPKIDLPGVELPDLHRVAGVARDAAYVGVGATVVAVRAADERRRSLTEQVTTQVRKLVDAVA